MTLSIILGICLLSIIILGGIYAIKQFNKTERECIKLLNTCETIYDLKEIAMVSANQHYIENLFGRDPLKLYPARVQERYKRKYG